MTNRIDTMSTLPTGSIDIIERRTQLGTSYWVVARSGGCFLGRTTFADPLGWVPAPYAYTYDSEAQAMDALTSASLEDLVREAGR